MPPPFLQSGALPDSGFALDSRGLRLALGVRIFVALGLLRKAGRTVGVGSSTDNGTALELIQLLVVQLVYFELFHDK